MSKNQENWEQLFDDHKILEEISKNGIFIISSKMINKYRESRLMAKFDYSSQRPKIFKDNGIVILPIKRGAYALGKFDLFFQLKNSDAPDVEEPICVEFLNNISSISPNNIFSESVAINSAYISGIFDQFAEEKVYPTLEGRMGTGSFEFQIKISNSNTNKLLTVENSQCEIDSCFEGDTKILLLEAKNIETNDFNIRQLFYPYKILKSLSTKQIIPILFIFSNDIFRIIEFKFQDDSNINSIKIQNIKRYTFVSSSDEINLDDIENIMRNIKFVDEPPKTPFPQANDFKRVLDLTKILSESPKTHIAIAENYDFAGRQASYHTDAGKYLGLKGIITIESQEVLENIEEQINSEIPKEEKELLREIQKLNSLLRLIKADKIDEIEQSLINNISDYINS